MTAQTRSQRIRTIAAGGLLTAFALSTAACQQDVAAGSGGSGTGEAPAPTQSAAPENPNANQPSLTLTDDGRVNAARLPQDEKDVRPQLDKALGTPKRSAERVCEAGDRPDKLLRLTYPGGVTFSGWQQPGESPEVSSWSITGHGSEAINAPHSIYPGDSAAKVRANVLGVRQNADTMTFDTPVLEKGKTVWVLDAAGKTVKAVHHDVSGTGLGMPCQ